MFRRNIPAYPESVIRELMGNALVHRPYTIRGDIFLNIHPDYIEIVNPGLLPIGVTADNILHVTKKRNEHMAALFYALHLMEREGSGYDMMYEKLLANGKSVPIVEEGDDYVKVRVELVLPVPSTKAMSDTAPVNAPVNAPVKLSKTQSAIIKVLLKDNRATYEDLARTIGVDRTTIRRNIAVLKEKGVIRRVGEDNNGYWEVLISIENVV